jgi:hypothetical protein
VAFEATTKSTTFSECEAKHVAMAYAVKMDALPMVEIFSLCLGRPIGLTCLNNDTQCIQAVRTAFGAALRWLPYAEHLALITAHEKFFGFYNDNFTIHERPTVRKGIVMAKRLPPCDYGPAVANFLGMIRK